MFACVQILKYTLFRSINLKFREVSKTLSLHLSPQLPAQHSDMPGLDFRLIFLSDLLEFFEPNFTHFLGKLLKT